MAGVGRAMRPRPVTNQFLISTDFGSKAHGLASTFFAAVRSNFWESAGSIAESWKDYFSSFSHGLKGS